MVLRGANDYMLDEIERSLHDSMCVVKRVLESNSVVPGGGCVEAALSIYMESVADTMVSFFFIYRKHHQQILCNSEIKSLTETYYTTPTHTYTHANTHKTHTLSPGHS